MVNDKRISVYIVEDYLLMRKSLLHILSKTPEINVLGAYESAEAFLDVFNKQPSDVVIMDLGLTGMNGLRATKIVKEKSPETKVIILTSHEKEEEVLASLAIGANAYCLKETDFQAIISIIKDVYKGVLWLHPQVASVANSIAPMPYSMELDNLYVKAGIDLNLTDREMNVLKLIVDGKTNAEIADIMSISPHTAKAHVGKVLFKLSVNDRVQAAVKAIRTRIVE